MAEVRRLHPGKNMRPYLKNIKSGGTRGMAQVVEHLLSKLETLEFTVPQKVRTKNNPRNSDIIIPLYR
jgi:hypothetical protein